ncbi:MAG: hypothetical protein JXA21_01495 [Anaerolineae bacterium]|nr:hypothetical protein [Anaerolineae bacterium]
MYQGRLTDNGSPANGSYDLTFSLYDVASEGLQVGSTVTRENTSVSAGLFTVQLDFDSLFYGTSGGDFITAYNTDTTDLQFMVASNGDVCSDGSFNTPAADFAEMLLAVDGLTPGEVRVIGLDGELTRSTQAYQRTIVGVYSTQPGFVGGASMDGDTAGRIPLAVVGVAPVKVSAENGPISPGDMLVASAMPGHAMRADDASNGSVIGKALEGLNEDTGVILMLVMLQ